MIYYSSRSRCFVRSLRSLTSQYLCSLASLAQTTPLNSYVRSLRSLTTHSFLFVRFTHSLRSFASRKLRSLALLVHNIPTPQASLSRRMALAQSSPGLHCVPTASISAYTLHPSFANFAGRHSLAFVIPLVYSLPTGKSGLRPLSAFFSASVPSSLYKLACRLGLAGINQAYALRIRAFTLSFFSFDYGFFRPQC